MFVCVGDRPITQHLASSEMLQWWKLFSGLPWPCLAFFLPCATFENLVVDLRQQSPIWLTSLRDVWIELSWSSSLGSSISGQWPGGDGWLLTGASLCGSSIFKPGLFPGRQQFPEKLSDLLQARTGTCPVFLLSIKAGRKNNSDSKGG